MSPEVEGAATRAAWRGPVPEDPEVRAAALRLIDHQLAEARRQRTLQLVVFGVAVPLDAAFAFGGSPWWWVAMPFSAVMFGMALLLPRRMRRRAGVLRGPGRGQ